MIKNNQQGFVLISLILAAVIIVVLVLYYFKNPKTEQSTLQTGQKAIEQTKTNNEILQQQHEQIQIQNDLNSIGN